MDQAADLVIRNARVYTLDSERPWVEAIAVKGDRISYVGSDEGAEEYVGESTRLIAQASVRRLSMYKTALEEGHLKSRLQIALYHPPGTTQKEVDRFAEARRDYNDDRIRVSAIKLYIDDVIEPHTAALLEPYADLPGERGDTFYAPETFNEVVTRLDAQGFQLFIHAIGDRGISSRARRFGTRAPRQRTTRQPSPACARRAPVSRRHSALQGARRDRLHVAAALRARH